MPITDLVGGHTLGNTNVTIDTNRFVFGTASARFTAANGSRLTIPSDSDPTLNIWYQGNAPTSGSMTYEFWFFPSSTSQNCNLFSTLAPDSSGVTTDPTASLNLTLSGLTVTMTSFAKSAFNQTTSGTAINGWNHVAIVVPPGSGIILYLNGAQVGGLAFFPYHFFAQPTFVGSNFGGTGAYFDGWIDDLRYTPSQRYSGAFTPGYAPAAPQWVTGDTLTLVTGTEGQTVNATITANAVDPQANGIFQYGVKTVSYSLDHFSITNTGLVTATLPPSNTPFVFTVDAVDTNGNHSKTHTYTLQSAVTTIPELKYSWRFDAANASTFIVPNVGSGTPSLANGTATYTAAPSPYSANNALHLQANAQITMPTSTNFEFLANANWTVEFWADINSSPSANNSTLLSVGPLTANTGSEFRVYNNINGVYSFGSQSTFGAAGAGVNFSAPQAGWNHFAVVRNGNAVTTFMNGTICNTLSNAATVGTTLYDNGQLTINGMTGVATGKAFSDLYLRGLNFFNVSKYTENFTPVFNDYFQPIWKSNVGVIFSALEGNTISTNVSVLAEAFGANNTLTYSAAGSLPSGITVSANGLISGTVPAFSHTSGSPSFSLIATDLANSAAPNRSFIVNALSAAPVFANSNLGYGVSNTAVSNLVLNAVDPKGMAVSYSLQNGSSLPASLTLNSNGLVSGTLTQVTSDTNYQFVVNAVNNSGLYNPSTLSFTSYTSADPLFLNTSLLLHADGSFQDTSPANTTVTVVGANATISNSTFKWGNGSVFLNNVTSSITPAGYITAPFTGITGDWTVEMWVNLPSLRLVAGNATEYLFTYTTGINGTNSYANSIFTCFLGSAGVANGVQYFGCRSFTTSGSQNGSDIGANNTVGLLTLNTWHNIAVSRQGTNVYLFWDGVLVNSGTIPAFQNIAGSFFFGVGGNSQAQLPFYGYMDDIRVTQGTARYTANYTVQPYAYASIRDQSPLWSLSNTNVAFDSNGTASVQLNANVAVGTTATYTVASGSLPNGLTLNSNGLVSGQTNTVVYQGQSVIWSNSVIKATDSASASFSSQQPVSYAVQQNDIYWGNVATLIHAEDTPNSTVLTDSAGKLTYTLGSALVSTANKKFGSSSLFFNGTTSATGIAQSQVNPSSVNFGTNAFTMEAWVYPTSLSAGRAAILSLKNPTTGPVTTDLAFYWHLSGSNTQANAIVLELDTQTIQVSAAAAITMNAWNHLAFVRSGATFSFFLNGTLLTTRNDTAAPTAATSIPFPSGSTLQIGGLTYSGTSSNLGGYLDEIRITNGTARYTGNFVVQQLSWPNSPDTTPFWSVANTNLALDTGIVENIQLSALSGVETPPSTFSVLTGSLPSGLTLNSNGLVTGTTQVLTLGSNVVVSNSTILAVNGQYSNTSALSYVVQPADQFWTNATLLHADGNFIDNGGNALVWTSAGGASLSNSVSKFGTGSFNFPGVHGAWVTSNVVPSQFNLGSNNWTVEMWANVGTFPANTGFGDVGANSAVLFSLGANGNNNLNALSLGIGAASPTGNINAYSWKTWNGASPGTTSGVGSATVNLPQNTWNHYAAQRTGNFVQLYVNGQMVSNVAMTNAITYASSYFITLGSLQANAGGGNGNIFYYPLNGFIDEFRLTLNQARYTSNFTVQQYSYPNQADPTPIWSTANTNLVLDSFANTTVTLSASSVGGAAPVFSVISGSLPSGMTLNSNGSITGTTQSIVVGSNSVTYNATVMANNNGFIANTGVTYTVQADDPFFSNTVMLAHFDDLTTATTFVDSTGKNTLAAVSGANTSTAQSMFGGKSLFLNNTDYITVSNTSAMTFGANDFTIETWVYATNFNNNPAIIDMRPASTNGAYASIYLANATPNANTAQPTYLVNSITPIVGNAISTNTWYHIAVSRKGGQTRMFVNGAQTGNTYTDATTYLAPTAGHATIGAASIFASPLANYQGYMDDFRITNGTGRYTANFTVAALPFPNRQDPTPVWSIANTVLGFDANTLVSFQLSAPSAATTTINYSLSSGALPTGLALNANGLVIGNTGSISSITVSNATIAASVGNGVLSSNTIVSYTVQPNDQFFANVALLMHGDGNFTDTTGRSSISVGTPTISSTSKFGSGSISFPSIGNGTPTSYVRATPPAAFALGTQDFTVEMWVNMTANPNTYGFLYNYGGLTANSNQQNAFSAILYKGTDTGAPNVFSIGGFDSGGNAIFQSGTASWNLNSFAFGTWNHIALSRVAGVYYPFQNGTLLTGTAATVLRAASTSTAYGWQFGTGLISTFNEPFYGLMDDIRITIGTGRYTTNFTPPPLALPNK